MVYVTKCDIVQECVLDALANLLTDQREPESDFVAVIV